MGKLRNTDLVGKKYGKLTIIKDLGTKGKNYIRWVDVRCDCGGYNRCRFYSLKSGNKTHCGCELGVKITVGEVFGRITVLADLGRKGAHNERHCLGQCVCGTMKTFNYHKLRDGHTKSCGCLVLENMSRSYRELGVFVSNEYLYSIWAHMKSRCGDPNNYKYEYYGGKGVKVCDEWKDDYLAFRAWAYNNGYEEGQRDKEFKNRLSIDRINSSGNYEPNNCQFLTVGDNSRKAHRKKGGEND